MRMIKHVAILVAGLCLSGCFLSTKTPMISPEDAVFPIALQADEDVALTHCGRDDEDLSDWSDCKPLIMHQADGHYVVTDPDDDEESYAIRFASFSPGAALERSDFIYQVSSLHKEDDDHIYGFARKTHGKLFLALADAQFVKESTCLAIGAEYPAEEKSCTGAIDDFFELQTVLKDVADAAHFTMYIELPAG